MYNIEGNRGMPGIFICYRRDDASPYAGRLYDHLSARFGAQRVFMDIDTIRPGDDFVQVISDRVAACDALIAVIGRRWLGGRLNDPNDYVRIEIASALQRNVRVIPALVDGAQMPPASALPPDLAALSRRNAIEITNTQFRQNVERLIQVLEQTVKPGKLSLHRAFKMKMPPGREQPKPKPAAAQAAGTLPLGPIIAGAGAFFGIHLLRYGLGINSLTGSLVVETTLQCGAIFVILSARVLGDPLDRKIVLRLMGCWIATVLFSALAGAMLFRPIISHYGTMVIAAGGMYAVVQGAAALVFGYLARLALPAISSGGVFKLARTWGLGALLVWIAGLMSRNFTPPLLVFDLFQALLGGSIFWLLRERRA